MSPRVLPLVLASILLAACFPKPGAAPGPLAPAVVASARARWPDMGAESFEAGRQLFLGNCRDCHAYPDLAPYGETKWPVIMARMGEKSGFSHAETELVLRFVLAARQMPAAP